MASQMLLFNSSVDGRAQPTSYTSKLLVIGWPLLLPLSAHYRNKQQIYSLITYTVPLSISVNFRYACEYIHNVTVRNITASLFENITVNIVTEVHWRKEQGVIEQKGYRLEGQPLAALDGITGVINPHLDLPSKQVE